LGAVNKLKKIIKSIYIINRNQWLVSQILEKKHGILKINLNKADSAYNLFKKSKLLKKSLRG